MTQATEQDVEQLVTDYEELVDGTLSKLDVLGESLTYHAPGLPEEGLQQEAFKEFLGAGRQRFPDLRVTIENSLVGDEVTM